MHCRLVALIGLLVATSLVACPALTWASYEVQVGYADSIRPSPFFPNPWLGDAGVVSAGATTDGFYDTGAIRIINNTGAAITFNDLVVNNFGDGASFAIWGAFAGTVIPDGSSMIFAQTASYNFDSSDDAGGLNGGAAAQPVVTFTVDGVTTSFTDTAQVLNTEGSDHLAAAGLNESHQWRDIGTFGGQAGVPEPSTVIVWSLLGALAVGWWRRRKAA